MVEVLVVVVVVVASVVVGAVVVVPKSRATTSPHSESTESVVTPTAVPKLACELQ